MEKVKCGQVSQVLKKGKKKQAKGELDRLKQAEKKKRRLEKALATSAAIRSELEKKKQKKIEEQQRLDAEGAAVAEAVALHVLIGEDTDDSCHFIMNNNTSKHNPWDYSSDNSHMMGYQNLAKYSVDGLGWATDACVPACKCNNWGIGLPFPPQFHVKDIQSSSYDEVGRGADLSVGLVAAQAVASLQIAEDSHGAQFAGQGAATVVINKLLGGSNMGNKVNIYRKI